jgi:hypothetical protein
LLRALGGGDVVQRDAEGHGPEYRVVHPAVPDGPRVHHGILFRLVLQMLAVALCILFPEIVLWLPRKLGYMD